MYSTYFVSILTIIERIYQIQSKTAGAILSATEIGQILGSLFIAYYGGRGNKPKWMSVCMTLSAIAALISISPHFIHLATTREEQPQTVTTVSAKSSLISNSVSSYQESDLTKEPGLNVRPSASNHLCHSENLTDAGITSRTLNNTNHDSYTRANLDNSEHEQPLPVTIIITIFSICLLVIGFGSTAITTLGIPFIDDIISREESPLYLGLTIALRIFGPALGFLLGSFCISLDSSSVLSKVFARRSGLGDAASVESSGWWIGLVVISLPLLILAIPMYFLSKNITINEGDEEDYGDITYQAAEDHDIGGSHDFPVHLIGLGGELDITSNRAFLPADLDSSHPDVLQICPSSSDQFSRISNYQQNIAFEQSIMSEEGIAKSKSQVSLVRIGGNNDDMDTPTNDQNIIDQWTAPNVCLVVNYLGTSGSTSFRKEELARNQPYTPAPTTRASTASTGSFTEGGKRARKKQKLALDQPTISDLSSSLSRLLQNKLLILRMLSGVLHILPIAGFYTFLPKYLMEQFRVTSSSASVISGLAGILFVGFGAFIGGTVIRIFNVNSKLMTRWIAASALLYSIGMIILMNLSCDQNRLVHFGSTEIMSSGCSLSCDCAQNNYNPVCYNGETYVTPCLAGCKSQKVVEGKVVYQDCGCSNVTSGTVDRPSLINDSLINMSSATKGQCLPSCDSIIWYVILFSIFTLVHSSCEVGSMMFNLRCVKPDDRTLALGLITFSSSLLGKWLA